MKISTTKAAHAIAQSWDLSHHDEKKVKRAMKKAHIHCELHKSTHDKSMTAEVRVQIHGGEEKTIKVVQDKHDQPQSPINQDNF